MPIQTAQRNKIKTYPSTLTGSSQPRNFASDRMTAPLRALVLDSPALCRICLARFLETCDIDVVGQASTQTEALALAHEHQTDIVLLNVSLMVTEGFHLVSDIREAQPHCAILLLAMTASDEQINCAQQFGAHGYLVKDINPEELLAAILRVRQGDIVFPNTSPLPGIVAAAPQRQTMTEASRPPVSLTNREEQVLQCLIAGLTDRAIARRLNVSEYTVKNHMKNIRQKLGVNNRVQASLRALELGLRRTLSEPVIEDLPLD